MKYLFFVIMAFYQSVTLCYAASDSDNNTCNSDSASTTFTGEVHYQRDDPIEKESEFITPGIVTTLNCGLITDDKNTDRDVWYQFKVTAPQGSANIDGVFLTNLTGVGIRFYHSVKSYTGFVSCNLENSEAYLRTNSGYIGVKCHWMHDTPTASVQVEIKPKLMKLSNPMSSGTVMEIPSLIESQVIYNYTGYVKKEADLHMSSSVHVLSDQCTLTSDTMAFDIGNVGADQFNNSIGFTPQKSAIKNLSLSCDANANINITLNGEQNPDSSDDSVLALSNQGQSGVADGVGIQLLYNDSPLEINKTLELKRSEGGQESFPITARYFQTKNQVTPGRANATATINLTYQ